MVCVCVCFHIKTEAQSAFFALNLCFLFLELGMVRIKKKILTILQVFDSFEVCENSVSSLQG